MQDIISRFFGGPPIWVAVRLIVLSILVGVVLSALGFDPLNIIGSFQALVQGIWNMGWDAVRWLWGYFLLGAVLVVPIWFVVRLAKSSRRS